MVGERRKLIVVSNRGPVSFSRDEDGNRVGRRGGGGLVTALRSLVAHHDVTWIASAITDEDRAVVDEAGGHSPTRRTSTAAFITRGRTGTSP
jgi:trehalose 6-phosphate synthase